MRIKCISSGESEIVIIYLLVFLIEEVVEGFLNLHEFAGLTRKRACCCDLEGLKVFAFQF